jgi:hypothetical protein
MSERKRNEHGGCPTCGKLVSRTSGHGPGCDLPTADEAPAELPVQVPSDNRYGSVPNPR